MKKLGLFITGLLLLFNSCKPKGCQIEKINTLYVSTEVQGGIDTSYGHYVLLKGFFKTCMDSLTMVKIAYSYIDSVKSKKPINVVMFYNSDRKFLPGTIPDDPNLDKDCLVKIFFNKKTKPYNFIFYGVDGQVAYWGNSWRKLGGTIKNR